MFTIFMNNSTCLDALLCLVTHQRVKSKEIVTGTRPERTNMAMTPTGVPKKAREVISREFICFHAEQKNVFPQLNSKQ